MHLWTQIAPDTMEARSECQGENGVIERGWGRPFEEPIEVDGRSLATLREAGEYIAGLPKKEHDAPEWRTAMEALLSWWSTEAVRRCSPVSGSCGR